MVVVGRADAKGARFHGKLSLEELQGRTYHILVSYVQWYNTSTCALLKPALPSVRPLVPGRVGQNEWSWSWATQLQRPQFYQLVLVSVKGPRAMSEPSAVA